MFDPIFDAIARALAGIYALPVVGGNYGVSIFLLTMVVMVVLMPLTLKATRSTIKMQMVQPQVKQLQTDYKDRPREEVNTELMALYQREGINPVGGCLPMLAQAPVFLVMFRVIQGLTRRASDVGYYDLAKLAQRKQSLPLPDGQRIAPKFLDHTSQLYQDLASGTEMRFGFLDLAQQPNDVLKSSIISFIPYLLLIILVVAGSYYQQRQVTARRQSDQPATGAMAQQQMLLKFLPLMTGVWSFFFPTGLVLYWAYQSIFRIAQQGYITRSLYGEDGMGTLATQKKAEDKKAKPTDPTPESTDSSSDHPGEQRSEPTEASETNKSETTSAREAFFQRKRDLARRTQISNDNGSSRVTPKGTKSAPAKKKRKR